MNWYRNAIFSSETSFTEYLSTFPFIRLASGELHNMTDYYYNLHKKLPNNIKDLACNKYKQMVNNLRQAGLTKIKTNFYDDVWSAPIGSHYRALAVRRGNTYHWYWTGTHEEYNRVKDAKPPQI